MSGQGLWLDEHRYMDLGSGDLIRYPQGSAGSRHRVSTSLYGAFNRYFKSLPNPDIVLRKLGKGIEAYEELKIDAQVQSCLESRESGVLRQKWAINRDAPETRESLFVKSVFEKIDVYKVAQHLLSAPAMGAAYMEVLYRLIGGMVVPTAVVDRSVRHFVYDSNNQPRLRTRENHDGELLENRKWLITTHRGSYENPYGDPLLSRCFWPVQFKKNNWKFWARMAEKYGMPFLVGKLDYNVAEEDDEDQLFEALDMLAQDGVAVISKDAEVDLLEAARSSSSDLYGALMAYCDSQITKAILSHADATDSTAGKLGGDNTALTVRTDIVQSDTRMVEKVMNQLIEYICFFNFYSFTSLPKFTFYTDGQINTDLANRDKTLADTKQIRFTKKYWVNRYGFKEDEIEVIDPVVATPSSGGFSEYRCSHDHSGGPDTAHNLAVSRAANNLAGSDASLEAVDKLLQPVVRHIQNGDSYDEMLSTLHRMYGDMDTDAIESIIRRALFAADTVGRLSVTQDRQSFSESNRWDRYEQKNGIWEYRENVPAKTPPVPVSFEALRDMTARQLRIAGLGKWDDDGELWLFPFEWYEHIPEGFEIVDIFGETEVFKRGRTDNDHRFGYLAYGVRAVK